MRGKKTGKAVQDTSGGFLPKTGYPVATGKAAGRTHTGSVHTTRKNGKTGTEGGRGQSEASGASYKGQSGGGYTPGFGKK